MTAYAADFTARLKVKYRANGKSHTFQMRGANASILMDPTYITLVTGFLATLASFMPTDFTVLSAGVADAGDSFFLPLSTPPVAPVATGTLGGLKDSPQYFTFVGLTTAGSSVRLFLIGSAINPDFGSNYEDYRITPTEVAQVGTAITALNACGAGGMIGNDGHVIAWYPYANLGYNAYWQRKARS